MALFKTKKRTFKKRASKRERGVAVEHPALAGAELPSFPEAIGRALRMLRTDRSSLSAVGAAVAADPRCSVQVLGLVNSAARSLSRRVDNVAHAAALLGREQVESVLLAASVSAVLPQPETDNFIPARFWQAAARRALLAAELAAVVDRRNAMSSYTAALLADVAQPVLLSAKGDAYDDVLGAWRSGGGRLCDLERHHFDWDHAAVGREVAAAWSMPESLAHAIGDHHAGEPQLPAVGLVAMLDEDDGRPIEDQAEPMIERARDEFGLAPDQVVAMIRAAADSAEPLAATLVR